jgi:tetratricopeptide (TPR) repeat protein
MDSLLIADHSGSINGFGTYMARIPVDSGFVAVLKNQRSDTFIEPAYATDIGNQILSILYGDEVEIPRKSIAKNIGFLIGTKGIDYALSEYHRIAKDESETFNLEEMELNKLGIELYFRFKMTDEALEIFRINMLQYPGSYNTYDSYAYVLMKKGDYKNAIKYYKKGLEVLKSFPLENGSESVRNDSMKARQYIIEMEEKLK